MTNNQRILQLLESMLDSESTPEQICADCPELLPMVRQRWNQYQNVEAEVNAIFPVSAAGISHGVKWAPLVCGCPQIPGYEIRDMLGRGGMGVVYRAQHLGLNRTVAIKMLLSGVYASPVEITRFSREAKMIAGLQHPHLVQVYDVGESEGCPYFTMELVGGGSLAQLLGGAPQSPSHAAKTIATLSLAVQAAHNDGIVHRDLKPSNILLTHDGVPKISDFGLARHVEDDADLTLSGARIGTPSYMAPEQFTNRSGEVGPLSDIYSLGAILYEMLTGRPPFRADTVADTERQLICDDPARPSRLNTKIPPDLETICLKCLQKDPDRRYANAKSLADDLSRFLNGEPINARPVSAIERVVKWTKRRRALAALIAVSVFVMASLIVVFSWQFLARLARTRAVQGDIQQAVDLERRGQWEEARTQYLRAAVELGSHGPPALRRQLDEGNRDLDLVARLDSIYLGHSDIIGTTNEFDHDAMYAEAFKQVGLDVLYGTEIPSIAARIRQSPIRIAMESAIDNWATSNQNSFHLQRLLALAQACDDNPNEWEQKARNPRNWNDKRTFDELIETADIKTETLSLLMMVGKHFDNLGGDAVPFLIKVQQEYPNDFHVNLVLGNCEYKAKDNADAIRYFQAAVVARPTAAIAEHNLGFVLQFSGHTQEAIVHYRRAVQLSPSVVACHHVLAMALSEVGQNAEAIQEAHRAVDLAPNDSYLHVVLAHCLEAAGQIDPAMAEYHRALALEPLPGKIIIKLKPGDTMMYDGTLEQRQADWKAYLDTEPEKHEKWSGYAELCLYLGKDDEYRRTRTRLLARFGDTTDPLIAERTGRACLLLPGSPQETQQAVALVERANADHSKEVAPYVRNFRIARQLAEYRMGHFDKAIKIANTNSGAVLKPMPQLIQAMALYRNGQTAESQKALSAALLLYDWNADSADANAWMFHVLRRQAEKMIRPSPTTSSGQQANAIGICPVVQTNR
jgi:eukaryotic-like serine/threonine-protein kinase